MVDPYSSRITYSASSSTFHSKRYFHPRERNYQKAIMFLQNDNSSPFARLLQYPTAVSRCTMTTPWVHSRRRKKIIKKKNTSPLWSIRSLSGKFSTASCMRAKRQQTRIELQILGSRVPLAPKLSNFVNPSLPSLFVTYVVQCRLLDLEPTPRTRARIFTVDSPNLYHHTNQRCLHYLNLLLYITFYVL